MLFKSTACLLLVLLTSSSHLRGDDWRTWRGPHQDGHIEAEGYFGEGPISLRLAWQQHLGSSYSGLAVSQGRLLIPFADGVDDWLAALDAKSGDLLWKHRIGRMYPAHDGGHDGPLSTPVADDQQVYMLGPRGKLFALDLESGIQQWSVDLRKEYSAKPPYWGFCTTPALHGPSLFVQVSGNRDNGVLAFDKSNGTVQWKRKLRHTDYRSPIISHSARDPQLICSSRNEVFAFKPATGESVWKIRYQSDKAMTPIATEGNRLLLCQFDKVDLFQVDGSAGNLVWSAEEFYSNVGTPVHHRGYFFGFSNHALTCVDASTGQRMWRSRRPGGGKGQIIVDDHLVMFSVKGDMIVAKATHEGYHERARLHLSSADGYAAPIFADGMIFARDLHGMVYAVAASDDEAGEVAQAPAQHQFAKFIQSLERVNGTEKDKAITEFLDAQKTFPIVEDDRLVHFVFRGKAEDVAIRGSMMAMAEEDAMQRVPGTDLFYRTYDIEPGARWEYLFIVDFDNYILDPRNDHISPFDTRQSEVFTSVWTEPAWAADYEGQQRGKLQQVEYEAGSAQVYLPPGYEDSERRYKTLVAAQGDGWLKRANILDLLDQLHATGIEPTIVVFPAQGGSGGSDTEDFAKATATQLIPKIDATFRTRVEPSARAIMGRRGAAVAATITALRYPQVFGHCIAISYGRADTVRQQAVQRLASKLSGPKPTFHVAWNRYEVWRPQSFHCRAQSQELCKLLDESGFSVTGGEVTDSSNWRSWRTQLGNALSLTNSQWPVANVQ